MNIKFDSEPVYGDNNNYITAKIKPYRNNVNANFRGKKIPKEKASYICLSLIMLDSVIKVSKKYYSQILLEKSKYQMKNPKLENLINEDLDLSLLIMNLIMKLIRRLNLIMNLTMNNLLKFTTVF